MPDATRLVVIGAGPGGYTAAFHAADLGMRVTLVDESPRLGGVCLQRGCIPSKALLHAAGVIGDARRAARWGVAFGAPAIDLDRLRGWKDEVVSALTGGLGRLAQQRAVTFLRGRAAFADPHKVMVEPAGGGEPLGVPFDYAIVATGSRPVRPAALALDDPRVMDSTGALEIARASGSLLVVGGGYIGLELGAVYAALGCTVTVVEMTAGLLPGVDADLVRVVARQMDRELDGVRLRTRVAALRPRPDGIEALLEGPDGQSEARLFDQVLVAVGRSPNSRIAGLERTAVELDGRGFVVVDAHRRTAEPSIFAIGDVAGEPMLAHKAFHEARAAVETMAGRPAAFEPLAVPAVVFTDPEVAWCGLTETRAAAEGRAVKVSRFPWGASGRALTLDRPEGITKLVVDPDSEQLLGVGMAGAGAGELIAEGVLAVEMGATVSDLRLSIHPHPTMSETVAEAADLFFGECTHLYRPKRS
ncbi:MAG: dihydrolipoyl dehydrogenase [Acidobacteria bacterium]|nr:dihydrolipoyl dehydrogenase [Acidobacteriota bacterium]